MKKFLNKKGFTLVELMVVIVIGAILAAVAIPKFIQASHKAKASEFPTVLTQIFTVEAAWQAETGSYSDYATLTSSGDLSISPSKYFSYDVEDVTENTFTAVADVIVPFGDAAVDDQAYIDQDGVKGYASGNANPGLDQYCTSWQ